MMRLQQDKTRSPWTTARGLLVAPIAIAVLIVTVALLSTGGQLFGARTALADHGGANTINANYAGGKLTISGTYSFSGCNSGKAVGFAIFADGANPASPGTGALDGQGLANTMHPANMSSYVFPCADSGSWGPDSHNVAQPPTSVCVVIYDVHGDKLPPDTGNHSTVGAGSNRNTDNSYDGNGTMVCATVSTPTHTPTHTPTNTRTPTNTPTPTNTHTPTNTPINTPTNTPTDTPTPTRTSEVLPTVVTPDRNIKGDVNCDGKVNSRDALMILQLNAGLKNGLPCLKNADVNDDNRINALDAFLILQFEAGLIHHLPPP